MNLKVLSSKVCPLVMGRSCLMVKLDIVTYYSGARNSFVRQKNPVELYIVV